MALLHSIFAEDFQGAIAPGTSLDKIHEAIDPSQLSVFQYKDGGSEVFGSLLVTAISESFIEGESRGQLLSDGFVSFATGGTPTGISITGILLKPTETDTRADFIHTFDQYLRGTAVALAQNRIVFMLKQKTVFDLAVQRTAFTETADFPEITQITLDGVASNYKVLDTIESA